MEAPDMRAIAKDITSDVVSLTFPENPTLLQEAVAMTMGVKLCDEVTALEFCAARMVQLDAASAFTSEIMQVEEAAKTLTREDEELLVSERKMAASRLERAKTFSEEFRQRRKEAEEKIAAKDKSKAKPKPKGKTEKPRMDLAKLTSIDQRDAKVFMPPQGYLWKNNTDSSWCARCPPFPPLQRSWRCHGQLTSLKFVISAAWWQWCRLNGVKWEDAPVVGLLWEDETFVPAWASS